MKRPDSLSDANQICQDCITEWDKQIEVHPIQKEFKDKKYFTWANSDGSGHVTKVGDEFFHVWTEAEKAIAKEGQTAGLRAWRDAKKADEIKAEITPEGKISEEAQKPQEKEVANTDGPRVKEMDVVDFAKDSLARDALVQCKYIHVIEQVVHKFLLEKNPNVDPVNAHVGMYVKLIFDCMENNKA